jgi:hypothetical protein
LTIVHLTPELQPMNGGIADYGAILGRAIGERGVTQLYLVAGHGAPSHRQSIQAQFSQALVLDATTCNHLLRALPKLDAETVLLHYSGYGYAPRGAPVWLVEALERWKGLRSYHRLMVMFHETWASGLPWQSSFWLCPLQRWCVARIARLADGVVTNTSYYSLRLAPLLRPGTPIQVQPVFSNIGEPETISASAEREPICVLFGRAGNRRRVYQRFRRFFDELSRLGIERLVEIGLDLEGTAGLQWGLPIDRMTPNDIAEISFVMVRARYGLLDCPVYIGGKSGVLAALAAHGVVPIHPEGQGIYEGLEFGRHTVNISQAALGSGQPSAKSPDGAAVRAWYRKHRLERQVTDTWLPLLSAS